MLDLPSLAARISIAMQITSRLTIVFHMPHNQIVLLSDDPAFFDQMVNTVQGLPYGEPPTSFS